MKKYFTLLALALVTLVSCDKDKPGETPKKEYDVYTTGILFNKADGTTEDAAYWKNGVKVKLSTNYTQGSSATSVFVSNDDVYVTGCDAKDAVLELTRAVYWKNGNKVTLPEGHSIASSASASSSIATGICVVGNDIYISGGIITNNSDNADESEEYPVYWKNGELVELNGGVSLATSICVDGNDVYVLDNNGYWKNGVRVKIPFLVEPKNGYTSDMQIVGSDIYVAGYEERSKGSNIAQYWKNGVAVTLSEENAYATSIFVSGDDVYVSGADKCTDLVAYPTYWKNGVAVHLGDSEIDEKYLANKIIVLDNNIFVCGNCKEGNGYWINEKFHPVDGLIFFTGLFVVERK